jgi:hypothetical protein
LLSLLEPELKPGLLRILVAGEEPGPRYAERVVDAFLRGATSAGG